LLGILGGMGPQAGLDQAARIIAMTPAQSDQDHLPFVLFSMPGEIADRTAFLRGEAADNPAFAIAGQLQKMAALGVTVVVMACNTAHAPPIFDVVLEQLRERRVNIRMLHLVDETVAFILREHPCLTRIGVLATPGAYRTNLYTDALAVAGLEAIVPDEEVREQLLHAAVYDPGFGIKATPGAVSHEARQRVHAAVLNLREHGAEAVVLGCTELPLAIEEHSIEGIPILDPARIIAERLTCMLGAE
jgi:aspartate racemase